MLTHLNINADDPVGDGLSRDQGPSLTGKTLPRIDSEESLLEEVGASNDEHVNSRHLGGWDKAVLAIPVLLPESAGRVVLEEPAASTGVPSSQRSDNDRMRRPLVAIVEAYRHHVKHPENSSSVLVVDPFLDEDRASQVGSDRYQPGVRTSSGGLEERNVASRRPSSSGAPDHEKRPYRTGSHHAARLPSTTGPAGTVDHRVDQACAHSQSSFSIHSRRHIGVHKKKTKNYLEVTRKERIHHEFEPEDQGWMSALGPLLGALLMHSDSNFLLEGMHQLLPKLTQISQSREELLSTCCHRLMGLLSCRKVIFMEMDAENHFAVVASSDSDQDYGAGGGDSSDDKVPGGHGVLPLDPSSPPIVLAGAQLQDAFGTSFTPVRGAAWAGDRAVDNGSKATDATPGWMQAKMDEKIRKEEERRLSRLAYKRWNKLLGPDDSKSLLSCVCVDGAGRMHGAFVAVDHRIDALQAGNAQEFNAIHQRTMQSVSTHVASLLTQNEESTAKSAQLKSFNEMTSALQDVALCDTMPRLFAAVRDKFPELMDVQDITLYVADRNENGEEVLYSEAVEARYDVARHLHALFVSCCTSASSSKRESSRITSNALVQCLETLRIVPTLVRLERLYGLLDDAKLPIQAASRSEGSGYSRKRKDDIDVVKFQQILVSCESEGHAGCTA